MAEGGEGWGETLFLPCTPRPQSSSDSLKDSLYSGRYTEHTRSYTDEVNTGKIQFTVSHLKFTIQEVEEIEKQRSQRVVKCWVTNPETRTKVSSGGKNH